jgi:hypothetical protein
MSLVADQYSENDPVPCSIDDLAVTEIRDELKKICVETRIISFAMMLIYFRGNIIDDNTEFGYLFLLYRK